MYNTQMPIIESVDALIHPDFHLMNELTWKDEFVSSSPEGVLRESWDQRVREIAANPNRRLVYVSWLSRQKLESRQRFSNPWEEMDYERIRRYQSQLGERMFVAPQSASLGWNMSAQILAGEGVIDKRTTRLYAMGEWTDQCVKAEGRVIQLSLGISKENFLILPQLSRFSWEGKLLTEWHKDLREEPR